MQCGAYSFSSFIILDVATYSQKNHKLFSTIIGTYISWSQKIGNWKIEGSSLQILKLNLNNMKWW